MSALYSTLNDTVSPYPGLLLQSGHHDDGVGPLFPHHPPEVTQGLRQRPLSGDVGILLPVAVDVVGVDVVTAWNRCNKDINEASNRYITQYGLLI